MTISRLLTLTLVLASGASAAADLPAEWIDPDTGHRALSGFLLQRRLGLRDFL